MPSDAPLQNPRAFLTTLFEAAVAEAQPGLRIPSCLPQPPRGRVLVVGAGKAAAQMARALEACWTGPSLRGLVVVPHGHEVAAGAIEVLHASHPVPDDSSVKAALRMKALVSGLTADDLVIALFSGGGSALSVEPASGISLRDKQLLNQALLNSGASISEMNCVRRQVSAIKGGQLAAACHPARVCTLLISDVPGDHPEDIASGPTVADPSDAAMALDIVRRYRLQLPEPVLAHLQSGVATTIKADDPRLEGHEVHMIATPQQSLQAAAEVARRHGIPAHVLSDRFEGEARDMGGMLAALASQIAQRGEPFARPCVLLSGGESTVTLSGSRPYEGRGGRNVECALALALALRGQPGVYALMADTDGVDGQEPVAGAFVAPDTLRRAHALGVLPQRSLDAHDGHGFFGALGDAFVTGPTHTNVNDFRAVLVL
ncbi:glycerate kinase [Roseateles sp. BYS180W]|uniref:Glycerate kinase n=1 Tax=Roseateles rivi TaxID=3299028 RepID=A0ABW7FWJ3_9BURK